MKKSQSAVLLFSANLKRLRKEAGLTQLALSEKAGLAHNFITDLESRKTTASFNTIDKIAQSLEVEPAQLFIDPSHWSAAADPLFLSTLSAIQAGIDQVFDRYQPRQAKGE